RRSSRVALNPQVRSNEAPPRRRASRLPPESKSGILTRHDAARSSTSERDRERPRGLSTMTNGGRGGRLTLRRLPKRYPGTVAVDAIDLEVGGGEFVTLLGPSGSGKTTTLMMVAGFTPPSEGEIAVGGRPITGMAPEHRNIGVVFQNYALF